MSCHMSSSGIANRIVPEVKRQVETLRGELKRDFTQISDRQQAQLDRIEKQLGELLALLKPETLGKPSPLAKRVEAQP